MFQQLLTESLGDRKYLQYGHKGNGHQTAAESFEHARKWDLSAIHSCRERRNTGRGQTRSHVPRDREGNLRPVLVQQECQQCAQYNYNRVAGQGQVLVERVPFLKRSDFLDETKSRSMWLGY